MGNYTNLESEFIERTVRLIGQYEALCKGFDFKDQLNYTLTINCLLGLIVMPKEKIITCIPTERLTNAYKNEMGLVQSIISPDIRTLRDLIISLRHAIAHFDINVVSEDENNLIDLIEFKDTDNDSTIAIFRAAELFPFLQFYSNCLRENIMRSRQQLQ